MSNDEPTLTIKLSAYDKIREDLRAAQNENMELQKKLQAAQIADVSGTTQLLHTAFHDAIKVVQFAVGNLPSETVTGWPHEALVKIADAIEKIPGIDRHVGEMPLELRYFAQTARGYEEYRKQRNATRVVVAATAADFGPQTPEAAAVHAEHVKQHPPETPAGALITAPHDAA
jgi:hypothetical protein